MFLSIELHIFCFMPRMGLKHVAPDPSLGLDIFVVLIRECDGDLSPLSQLYFYSELTPGSRLALYVLAAFAP